jgi:TonB family protein
MHGEHAAHFKQFLTALQKGDANLLPYLNVSEKDLEFGFQNYVKNVAQRSSRNVVKVSGEESDVSIESIPDTEAQMSIAEIFLNNGKLPEARRHLEILAAQAPDSTRVSYYRGILSRISGDPASRDFFVDALLDPFLAPRAAVQLAQMGDMQIPAVRTILEEAAERRTRTPEVYLALANIYLEDIRRIEEAVRLKKQEAAQAVNPRPPDNAKVETVSNWSPYMRGSVRNIDYEMLSESQNQPRVSHVVVPYYPPELVDQKVGGEVVLDVQVTEPGKVSGIWMISATPEIFGNLATAAVREWEFEPIAGKIRVVVKFKAN